MSVRCCPELLVVFVGRVQFTRLFSWVFGFGSVALRISCVAHAFVCWASFRSVCGCWCFVVGCLEVVCSACWGLGLEGLEGRQRRAADGRGDCGESMPSTVQAHSRQRRTRGGGGGGEFVAPQGREDGFQCTDRLLRQHD